MIVVQFDADDMRLAHRFASQPGFFSGGPGGLGDAPSEALVNPRAIGFARDDAFYIPVYWCEGEG